MSEPTTTRTSVTVFLCGDVMTGRGLDQILPHPGDPTLHEPVMSDARAYVTLAEQVSGPIARPVGFGWPWGDALSVFDEHTPDLRVLNLETCVTGDGTFAKGKAVHYRMHPGNLACLTVARPDVCVLANNHVLDFGSRGLADTLTELTKAGIRRVGAGLDAAQAHSPASLALLGGTRVVIAAGGTESSGVPRQWAATRDGPGVAFVPDLSNRSAEAIAERTLALKRPGDIAIASLHWGSNWGYYVEPGQVRFAHRLVDAGVDLVHGHSSHHPRSIEVYRGKLILYGCGDLINDYEGIKGFEAYRGELRLLYFATLDPDNGKLLALRMVPVRTEKMRLRRVSWDDAEWLRSALEHISLRFATRVHIEANGTLVVRAR
ncbi:CapA family protein [Allokutzneria oryzae]|uniref:CapA family protein n=1 Tax=Allokutzneria oryzae TaxID=1378989 RepID=A0ABV6A0H0_9PSEU